MLGTSKGVLKYNGLNWEIIRIEGDKKYSGAVKGYCINSGNITALSTDNELYTYENLYWRNNFEGNSNVNLHGITTNYGVFNIKKDKSDNVWISKNGLYKISGKNVMYYSRSTGFLCDTINSIYVDDKGAVWFSTCKGIVKYFNSIFTNYTTQNAILASEYVYEVKQDKIGNYWVITNGGISKFDGQQWVLYKKPMSSYAGFFSNVTFDNNNVKIFKTNLGDIYEYNDVGYRKHGIVTSYKVLVDKQNFIWTIDASLKKFNGTQWITISFPNNQSSGIQGFEVDKEGNVWIVSGNIPYKWNGSAWERPFNTFYTSLSKTDDGRLIIDLYEGLLVENPCFQDVEKTKISGANKVVKNQAYTYSVPSIPGATQYVWEKPEGVIGNSDSSQIVLTFTGFAKSGNLQVYARNSCGISKKIVLKINVCDSAPQKTNVIAGLSAVKVPATYMYSTPKDSTVNSYIWTLPLGASGKQIENNIEVAFSSNAQPGLIKVKGVNQCGVGQESILPVTITERYPEKPLPINGPLYTCFDTVSYYTFTVAPIANATSYVWRYGNGIAGSSNTNSISIKFTSLTSVDPYISVRGMNNQGEGDSVFCKFYLSNNSYSVPDSIQGSSKVCKGSNVTYKLKFNIINQPAYIGYIWTLPSGAEGYSTQNYINVRFTQNAQSGFIRVKGVTACGQSAEFSKIIFVGAGVPDTSTLIIGNPSPLRRQINQVYTASNISGATDYIWSYPTGVTGASSTNSISLNFSDNAQSGNVSVKGVNGCGIGGSKNFYITVSNTLPSTALSIYGDDAVCEGSNGNLYSIPTQLGATSYEWVLPVGFQGVSDSSKILINILPGAQSGYITVFGKNSYGNAAPTKLFVKVNKPIVTAPVFLNFPDSILNKVHCKINFIPDSNVNNYIITTPNNSYVPEKGNSYFKIYADNVTGVGVIRLKAINSCPLSPEVSDSAVFGSFLPIASGSITGPVKVCEGTSGYVYTIPPMQNATYYVWRKNNTEIDTTYTNSIVLNIPPGNSIVESFYLSVSGFNNWGSKYLNQGLSVTIYGKKNMNFKIMGPEKIYTGSNVNRYIAYNYNLPDTTTFYWSYSGTGVTLSTVQRSSNVNLALSSNATSGYLKVFYNNYCFQVLLDSVYINVSPSLDIVEVNTVSLDSISSNCAIADYDADGLLDIATVPVSLSNRIFLYKNMGNGSFIRNLIFPVVNSTLGSLKWIDVNNDDLPDLTYNSNGYIRCLINKNTGFEDSLMLNLNNSPYIQSLLDYNFADLNNDGKTDLALCVSGGVNKIYIYLQNDSLKFTLTNSISISNYNNAKMSLIDINKDSYIDIILQSSINSENEMSLFLNNGNNTFLSGLIRANYLTGLDLNMWVDTDSDNEYECLSVEDELNVSVLTSYGNQLKIFKNFNLSTIPYLQKTLIEANDRIFINNLSVFDFNNDGNNDIVLYKTKSTGYSYANNSQVLSFLKQNNQGEYIETEYNLSGNSSTQNKVLAMIDYNDDSKLDLLVQKSMILKSEFSSISYNDTVLLFQNLNSPNTKPMAPSGLISSINNRCVTLRWNRSNDAQTSIGGLSYNLRIGTTPGGIDIVSPLSNPITGKRMIYSLGNAFNDTTWTIKDLSPGTYYWSVQAIDNGYMGSDFALEGTFTICSNQITQKGIITGPLEVCAGQTNVVYKVNSVPNANSYNWILSGGLSGTSVSDSIIVSIPSNVTNGFISVQGVNGCGTGDTSLTVIKIKTGVPQSVNGVTGISNLCSTSDSIQCSSYPVTNATMYKWVCSDGFSTTTNSTFVSFLPDSIHQVYLLSLKAVNSCGVSSDSSVMQIIRGVKPVITSQISGSETLCKGQGSVDYSLLPVSNAQNYFWIFPKGLNGNSLDNSININVTDSATTGYIKLGVSNNCGVAMADSMQVKVFSGLPVMSGNISGSINIVAGQQNVVYTVPVNPNATHYSWRLSSGYTNITTLNTDTIDYTGITTNDTLFVKAINSCGESAEISQLITVVNNAPGATGIISGLQTVCQKQAGVTYSVLPVQNASTYHWELPAGFNGTSTTNTIVVNIDSIAVTGNVTVRAVNSLGVGDSSVISVIVNPLPTTPLQIIGDSFLCLGANNNKYKALGAMYASSYNWILPTGLSGSSALDSINVNVATNAPAGTIYVSSVNSCGTSYPKAFPFNIKTIPPASTSIVGNNDYCVNQSGTLTAAPISGATSYVWNLPSGVTGSSTTNTITLTTSLSSSSGTVYVRGKNECGLSSAKSFYIYVTSQLPQNNNTISGPDYPCINKTSNAYSISLLNAVSYQWTLPQNAAGASITNNINVNVQNMIDTIGVISVRGINACGIGPEVNKTIVTRNVPDSVSSFVGPTVVCNGTSGVQYSVADMYNATSYLWTPPSGVGGVIGQSNQISLNFNSQFLGGDLSVCAKNQCGTGPTRSIYIASKPQPPLLGVIVGEDSVCTGTQNYTFSVPSVGTDYSYVWTLPNGYMGTSDSNTLNIQFSSVANSGLVLVQAAKNGCLGPSSTFYILVEKVPVESGSIVGNATVCEGTNNVVYYVPTMQYATSYQWTYPNGVTSSGIGNTVNVNFANNAQSGIISVYGQGRCGNSNPLSLNVQVKPFPQVPTFINGATSVCSGINGVLYLTNIYPNVNYEWDLPNGSLGSSQTNILMLNFGLNAVSDTLKVKTTNQCGSSPWYSVPITVISTPQIPVVSLSGAELRSSNTVGNQWYLVGQGEIAGANLQTFLPTINGDYYVITSNGVCNSDTSNIYHYDIVGLKDDAMMVNEISFFPNPVKNQGVLKYTLKQTEKVIVTLQTIEGKILSELINQEQLEGSYQLTIDSKNLSSGVYLIKLIIGKQARYIKVVK